MHRPALLPITMALAVAVALPGSAAFGQEMSYGLPSPGTAGYQMVDTTRMSMSSAMGPMDVSGNSSFTYALTFDSDGSGVRVSGELTDFVGRMTDPMGMSHSLTRNQAGVTDFVLTVGRRGLLDLVSESRRSDGDLALMVDPHEPMFPRLPAGEIKAGDTWLDTVKNSIGGPGARGALGGFPDL